MSNIDLLEDACDRLPHATKRMFGGYGLFARNGGMFAGIVTDDQIILKFADEKARAELVALGGEPWTYNEKMTMQEWILIPDAFYDEPARLAEWARRAHALAPPPKVKSKKAAKQASENKTAAKAPATKPAAKKATATKAAVKQAAAKKPTAKKAGAKDRN